MNLSALSNVCSEFMCEHNKNKMLILHYAENEQPLQQT